VKPPQCALVATIGADIPTLTATTTTTMIITIITEKKKLIQLFLWLNYSRIKRILAKLPLFLWLALYI
jgi:hypothetical protein